MNQNILKYGFVVVVSVFIVYVLYKNDVFKKSE